MKRKLGQPKPISITLTLRENELLKRYARDKKTTRPAAVKRMVTEVLRQYRREEAHREPVIKNQLELFNVES